MRGTCSEQAQDILEGKCVDRTIKGRPKEPGGWMQSESSRDDESLIADDDSLIANDCFIACIKKSLYTITNNYVLLISRCVPSAMFEWENSHLASSLSYSSQPALSLDCTLPLRACYFVFHGQYFNTSIFQQLGFASVGPIF